MSSWNGEERRSIRWDDIVSHMATVNQKLDAISKDIGDLNTKVGIQNGRVRKLEDWKLTVVGVGAGVGAVVGFMISHVLK